MPDNLNELKSSLRGDLVQPQDADYDDARKVYNGMIDKRPALIARCADVADVIAAVNFAREQACCSRSAAAATTAPASAPATTAWSSTSRRMRGVRVDPGAPAPCASRAAASGATSTTPPTPSAWPRRAASSPPPASAG